ncbi:MAG: protein-glutamate O-methyltransferase CheR [Gammaproteobacteria bacterium]|nr:protein-glutamate O-methyltransferase CheR [Gammaproteobacteria bacterium]MDH5728433.1 protein-glutamate O-methyltransferase CheR [Gammaproteobacteria bacterium]
MSATNNPEPKKQFVLPSQVTISDKEFNLFRELIYKLAGITLSDGKKALVVSRLTKRLRHYGLNNFSDYYALVNDAAQTEELQMMIDLLTTNETYFFREDKHFEFLQQLVKQRPSSTKPFRIWSAACSSGEEPYTIAMSLANVIGITNWEIMATDISTRVLATAQKGLYTEERLQKVPPPLLKKYVVKAKGEDEGMMQINDNLRQRINFRQLNLLGNWPVDVGKFDVIFLRNVMIYFDKPTKENLVARLVGQLDDQGHLLTGHSESLTGINKDLKTLMPSVYQKQKP